jgi:peptide/nickel transport system substrate-binding protein
VIATTLPVAAWQVVLHPLADPSPREAWLRNLIHARLVELDDNWSWQCQLCTALPAVANGTLRKVKPAGKSRQSTKELIILDFEIPARAKWGDGTALTGHDFRLGWEIANAMPATTRAGNIARAIREITVDGKSPRHFSVELKEPSGDFWFASGLRPVPSHLEATIWRDAAGIYADYLKNTTYTTDPGKSGLYSGPWFPKTPHPRAEGHRPFVLLDSNPGHVRGAARTPQLTIRFHRDEKTALQEIQSGDADILPETDINPPAMKHSVDKSVFRTAIGTEIEHIDFNLRNPLLTDASLRKAISMFINRHELARSVGMPAGLPMAYGLLHPAMTGLPVRTDSGELMNRAKFMHRVLAHAPSEAAALLQQSGWSRNTTSAGSFWEKEGRTLEIELDTSLVDSMRAETLRTISRQLSDAGIKISTKEHAADTFARDTLRKARFKYLALYAWRMPAATVPGSLLATRQIPTLQNGYSGDNTAGWSNKDVDETLELLRNEWDPVKRQEMLNLIEEKITADLPFVPLFRRPVTAAVNERVEGFKIAGHDGWSSGSAHLWKFGKDKASN